MKNIRFHRVYIMRLLTSDLIFPTLWKKRKVWAFVGGAAANQFIPREHSMCILYLYLCICENLSVMALLINLYLGGFQRVHAFSEHWRKYTRHLSEKEGFLFWIIPHGQGRTEYLLPFHFFVLTGFLGLSPKCLHSTHLENTLSKIQFQKYSFKNRF